MCFSLESIKEKLKGDLVEMINGGRLSKVIEKFFVAEVMAIIRKYMNLSDNTINEVEKFIQTIESEEVKEELYSDLDETLKVMRLVHDGGFNKEVITMYLWIKYQTNLDITLDQASYYYDNVKSDGYVVIDEENVIYRKNTSLRSMVREVLEEAMQNENSISRLLEKDEIIEYWLNGTSVSEAIDDLVNNTDARELLDLEQLSMFTGDDGEEYMYSYIDI